MDSRKKIKIIFLVVIFSGFCVCGLIVRNSIKDRCNDEKARDNFNVAYLSEDLMGLMEHVDEDLDRSKNIFVGKVTGKLQYVFGNAVQKIKVTKVIKTKDGVTSGEDILLSGLYTLDLTTENFKEIYTDTGFMDFMKMGDEYLIFADGKLSKEVSMGQSVYPIHKEAITFKTINLSDKKSHVCKKYIDEDGKAATTKYSQVKGCEIATNSGKVLKKFYQIKHKILKKYGVGS